VNQTLLNFVNGNEKEMEIGLQHVKDLDINTPADQKRPGLPIVNITTMNVPFQHEAFESIRKAFAIDEVKCCSQVPDADETVFVSIISVAVRCKK
jgi:hypothetical protein